MTTDDDWTAEDILNARRRLEKKLFHQLHTYITHVGQLRGCFDVAYGLLRDHGINDEEVKAWSDVDIDLVNIWGVRNPPCGLPLRQVGRADGEELASDLNVLLGLVEDRMTTGEPGSRELCDLHTAAAFLAQMSMTVKAHIPHMPEGGTADDQDEDDE